MDASGRCVHPADGMKLTVGRCSGVEVDTIGRWRQVFLNKLKFTYANVKVKEGLQSYISV